MTRDDASQVTESQRMRFANLLILIASVALAGPLEAEDTLPKSVYVTPATVKAWQQEGQKIFFLDVREADEFEAGHLPWAKNIVWTGVASLTGQLPKDRPIVTYCIHSAHRAPEAAKNLRSLGFPNAYVLEGGIVAWKAGGLTIHAADLAKEPTILPYSDRCASGKKQGRVTFPSVRDSTA